MSIKNHPMILSFSLIWDIQCLVGPYPVPERKTMPSTSALTCPKYSGVMKVISVIPLLHKLSIFASRNRDTTSCDLFCLTCKSNLSYTHTPKRDFLSIQLNKTKKRGMKMERLLISVTILALLVNIDYPFRYLGGTVPAISGKETKPGNCRGCQ